MSWRAKELNRSSRKSRHRSKAEKNQEIQSAVEALPPRSRKSRDDDALTGIGKLSPLRKPEGLSLEEWQRELRRQFGRQQDFLLKSLDEEPFFSEFAVTNPQSRRTYRVQIRGQGLGDNFCSCPDFATNTLGTCKHIEFALARLERKRGGRAALTSGWQPPYSEVFLHYGARREVRFRPGENCSQKLAREATKFFGSDGAMLPEAFARFNDFVQAASESGDELRCADDALSFIAEVRDAEVRKERVNEVFPKGVRSAGFKDLLKITLYDYQKEGALFAARAGRCLIGDEMGLGKTIQAVAAAEIMGRIFGVGRVLIICPTSLKHQWEREIQRFTDRTVQVINGMRPAREQSYAADAFFKITNYDTVYRDLDLIRDWAPDLVILDEAQRIKNWSTRTARSVKQIPCPYALVLTGTPLENRLEELISIVQFVDQFRLGPTFRLLDDHQVRDEFGKVVGYQNLDRIGQTLEPILIRRQKDQVLDQLPERIDTQVFVEMTPLQRKHHDENHEMVMRIVQRWRRYGFLTEADRQRLMVGLQRMRMSCDSAYLVDHIHDSGAKADEIATLLAEVFEQHGAKAVVFSQWLRMHELIVRRLKERGIEHVVFHGGVPAQKRKEMVDRFRDDPNCRAFLATDAGGVGLNLQHASVVINVDLPWNPAVLEQRIARVHRLGQRQPVRVVNFVAKSTIEEGMLSVLQFKRSLFAGVLDGGEKDVYLGGSRLTKFMETVEKVTENIPEATVAETEKAHRGPKLGQTFRNLKGAASPGARSARSTAPASASPTADPWSGLLQAGLSMLQQLSSSTSSAGKLVQRDERTGETYLRLPSPPPDVLQQALQGIQSLLQGLQQPAK